MTKVFVVKYCEICIVKRCNIIHVVSHLFKASFLKNKSRLTICLKLFLKLIDVPYKALFRKIK